MTTPLTQSELESKLIDLARLFASTPMPNGDLQGVVEAFVRSNFKE